MTGLTVGSMYDDSFLSHLMSLVVRDQIYAELIYAQDAL